MTKLRALHAIRQKMPYGGAILTVTPNGMISDGIRIQAQFMSQRLAEKALLAAGFKSLGNSQFK